MHFNHAALTSLQKTTLFLRIFFFPSIQAAIPGYGITGSCQTVNGAPLFSAAESAAYGYPADTLVTGFGHLPPWSGTEIPETPNDGVPLNTGAGGCLLNNGLPFSYMPVGSVFYDAFAAKFPRCTPEQAFGPATWAWEEVAAPGQNGTTSTTVLVDTGRVGNGTVHNAFLCLPVPQGGCCDVTGAIAPTEQARDACVFFVFLPFIGAHTRARAPLASILRLSQQMPRSNTPC